MANEFVARNGIKILTVPSGSSSNQVVVLNTTTNQFERRTDAGTSGTSSQLGFVYIVIILSFGKDEFS